VGRGGLIVYDRFRISVEALENGFEVEIPDFAEMAKKKAAAEKAVKGKGGADQCVPSPYYGDCHKKYAAKSTAEVLKLVRNSLEAMPASEFDAAFAEAAAKVK